MSVVQYSGEPEALDSCGAHHGFAAQNWVSVGRRTAGHWEAPEIGRGGAAGSW